MRQKALVPDQFARHTSKAMPFIIALQEARNVLQLSGSLATFPVRPLTEMEGWDTFLATMEAMKIFGLANLLDINSASFSAVRQKMFVEAWHKSFSESRDLSEMLANPSVAILGKFPDLLAFICSMLARNMSCFPLALSQGGAGENDVPCLLSPCNLPQLAFTFSISVLVAVNGHEDLAWIDEVSKQAVDKIEWLVVLNNNLDAELKTILEDLAGEYPNVRLLVMERPVSKARCRNVALLNATGKSALFIDGGCTFTNDFSDRILDFLDKTAADTFLFDFNPGSYENGNDIKIPKANGPAAFVLALHQGFEINLGNMIFLRQRLIDEKIFFNPLAPDIVNDFIIRAFVNAAPHICANLKITRGISEKECNLNASPESLKTANGFFNLLEKYVEACGDNGALLKALDSFARDNFNRAWLPSYKLLSTNSPEADNVPFPVSCLFTRAMLVEYANIS